MPDTIIRTKVTAHILTYPSVEDVLDEPKMHACTHEHLFISWYSRKSTETIVQRACGNSRCLVIPLTVFPTVFLNDFNPLLRTPFFFWCGNTATHNVSVNVFSVLRLHQSCTTLGQRYTPRVKDPCQIRCLRAQHPTQWDRSCASRGSFQG